MLHDNTAEPDIFSGKTCPEPYPADKATILHGWLQKWLASEMSSRPRTAGAAKASRWASWGCSSGAYWTRNGSESPSGAAACSLSSILETGEIPRRYYLSQEACRGILRRARNRGKNLPATLHAALTAVAESTGAPGLTDAETRSIHPGHDGSAPSLTASGRGVDRVGDSRGEDPLVVCVTGQVTHALCAEGADASEDGTGRGTPIIASLLGAFGGGNTSGAVSVAACLAAKGARLDFEVETFIVHGSQDPCVSGVTAFTVGRNQGAENVLVTSGAQYAVRRLTVLECERLQGFPDGWTLISAGNGSRCAADPDMRLYLARHAGLPQDDPSINKLAADGPRYKAIGNSMAVPVMRWIGGRIDGGDPDFEAGAPCFRHAARGWEPPKGHEK